MEPATFKSLAGLPEYLMVVSPTSNLNLKHARVEYYKQSIVGNGYYNLINPENPENPIVLYQSGMKILVKNLESAFLLAKGLQAHPDYHDDKSNYLVETINEYGTVKTRLVLNTHEGEVFIYVKVFNMMDDQELYPSRKCVRISPEDSIKELADFIKGKK